jgi:hypothetical protein
VTDPLTVTYYDGGTHDYADMVIRMNGTMKKGKYEVQVAKDSLLLSFLCAICTRSFDKKIIHKIMKMDYHESSARVVACDDTVLEMQEKKVRPKNGLFWGKPQVVRLKWKCTGVPTTVNKHDYPTEYWVKDKRGEWHVQCDCILLITVKKAEERAKAELEMESDYVDLFEIDRRQSQNDPPSPLPQCRKRLLEEWHEMDDVDEDEDEDSGNDNGGGGKQGG